MVDIDTEKLKEILEMMKDSGATYFQYDKLIIQFGDPTSTDCVGFEANGATVEETEAKKPPTTQRAVGYNALFGDKFPKFPRPAAEGKHV